MACSFKTVLLSPGYMTIKVSNTVGGVSRLSRYLMDGIDVSDEFGGGEKEKFFM